ncbi:hypothetical protein [Microbulbifer sp. S227A]|uniref:hypothetical protein n=1 Tax=Microbulbifer sp. S227A TaxID=3415131 RepID=UPI003C7A8F4A
MAGILPGDSHFLADSVNPSGIAYGFASAFGNIRDNLRWMERYVQYSSPLSELGITFLRHEPPRAGSKACRIPGLSALAQ